MQYKKHNLGCVYFCLKLKICALSALYSVKACAASLFSSIMLTYLAGAWNFLKASLSRTSVFFVMLDSPKTTYSVVAAVKRCPFSSSIVFTCVSAVHKAGVFGSEVTCLKLNSSPFLLTVLTAFA